MTRQNELHNIKSEIEDVFQKYGITPPDLPFLPTLTEDDSRRIRDLAIRIVQGDIDIDEISSISKNFSVELSNMVQQIIALTDNSTIKELEESNPYYEAFPARIVRDHF